MKFGKIIVRLFIIIIAITGIKFGVEKYAFPYKYKDVVDEYSKEYNLNPLFVLSIIKAESKFNPDAHSHKGAYGLMQITEDTGKWIADQMGIQNF